MKFSPLAQFDVMTILPLWWGKYEVTLTNLSLSVLFGVIVGAFLFIVLYTGKLIPRTWQRALEALFMFVYSLTVQQVGKEGMKYFPFVFALFTFMLMLNLLSMTPYGFAPTSHMMWTVYFSLSMCLGIFFLGMFKHKVHFFKLFVPEVPLFLYPIMMSIELLSYVMSSFSLAISLSANLMAGHTLVHIMADAVLAVASMKKMLVFMPFGLLLAIFVLELGVACLQAYMFVTLVCMYMNDSLHLGGH